MGCVYEGLGNLQQAANYFQQASVGMTEASDGMYYNDQPADTIFYQGLALEKLGKPEEAASRYEILLDYANEHMDDVITIDYFAVSVPDTLIFEEDLQKRNRIYCLYLAGLGQLGLNHSSEAFEALEEALRLNVSHQGIIRHLAMVKQVISKLKTLELNDF